METRDRADDFWQFSLRVYGSPGVEAACLVLQDRYGLDVNLILYCCWAGTLGVELDNQEMTRLINVTDRWQKSVVRPLREVRRTLKKTVPEGIPSEALETLRIEIKNAELRAEKLEQTMLAERLGEPRPDRSARQAAVRNLDCYWSTAVTGDSVEMTDTWTVIVDAAFANGWPHRAEPSR